MKRARLGRWRRAAILGVASFVLVAAPVSAGTTPVTHGQFHEFAAGVTQGLHINGSALMIRSNNRTFVVVVVTGLAPNTTYGSHVHKQACAVGDADGHYQFVPGGPADSVNEIWPGFTTNASGVGIGLAHNAGIAGPTAVAVVVHAPGGAKIACADLR